MPHTWDDARSGAYGLDSVPLGTERMVAVPLDGFATFLPPAPEAIPPARRMPEQRVWFWLLETGSRSAPGVDAAASGGVTASKPVSRWRRRSGLGGRAGPAVRHRRRAFRPIGIGLKSVGATGGLQFTAVEAGGGTHLPLPATLLRAYASLWLRLSATLESLITESVRRVAGYHSRS